MHLTSLITVVLDFIKILEVNFVEIKIIFKLKKLFKTREKKHTR
jgi:hypothetical protein